MAICKDKNEPGRFLGEGVSFRAKLIGVLEVPEARGDRMCQEALADLKMAIRAAGEHKQRIQVHVAIDGLRLRDDKTGDSLYHHPVHKISFIAQDMTDSRAFGYIFGSPDTGHRFFGIKTDKAASQVVIAMRDLFQVVFELKKKEVELAKQQLEVKSVTSSLVRHTAQADTKAKTLSSVSEATSSTPKATEANAEGGVAELVDLEQELSSLRRGLTQVEGLTPSTDPFGDSFVLPTQTQKGLLPPPPSGSSSRGRNTPASKVFSPNKSGGALPFDLAAVGDFDPAPPPPAPLPTTTVTVPTSLVDNFTDTTVSQPATSTSALSYDVFTELDPLGTGRSKPYVDKKLFFQELKNPPKKVLKDLVPTTQSLLTDIQPPSESKTDQYGTATTMTSLSRHSGGTVSIAKPQSSFSGSFFTSDPFAETDPFDNTDPFSDSFKDDPFTNMQEFPKTSFLRTEDLKIKLSKPIEKVEKKVEETTSNGLDGGKNVFNGPLQVTLPPEPAPKSPRVQRQNTDTSTVRQRPQSQTKQCEKASPPPPLPPKKADGTRPPPRPPHDHDEEAPPLPRPARKKEPLADRTTKPRLSSVTTNSSEEEYLTPAPPPLPAARRFDMTLTQLLVCSMPELAARLRVPEAMLSSMTLPQLKDYLRSYLASDNERSHVHVDPAIEKKSDIDIPTTTLPPPTTSLTINSNNAEKLNTQPVPDFKTEFKPQFEDNFAPSSQTSDNFVANFDDFDKKVNSSSYDRYAAFREIQEQELKSSILNPIESSKEEYKQDSDDKEEMKAINNLMLANRDRETEVKETSRSPLKALDELTLDSFNMFRSSVSPKPSQIDAKIEDIKSVMKNLQIDNISRRSVSPRENNVSETKQQDDSDRYAALREITITEPSQDEFESLPPEAPKERKRSDEKSDGFDNSDFFDCIDNNSLTFSNVEDAFRRSPAVREREDEKLEEKKEMDIQPPPPARLSTGSISDVVSGSSPEAKGKVVGVSVCGGEGGRWRSLGGHSPPSSDSDPPPQRRSHHHPKHIVQTSSSSREVSPWECEPAPRAPRPPSHHHSRHNSSGSRECVDSGSGREKDKRDKRERDRDVSRDGRDSGRDRRDSGSGRDRRDLSKERDHREHRDRRDRRSRDREKEDWDRERSYNRDSSYREPRSRDRADYRDRDRDRRHRRAYKEDEYSDGCGSGRSSPRERWPEQRWRRDERNYGSLGWRESRRRNEVRQTEEHSDRRYGTTLGWPSRRSGSRREADRDRDSPREPRDSRDPRDLRDQRDLRDTRDSRDSRRRTRREEPRRTRDYRFSNDFSPRERDQESPFDNDFTETPTPTTKKRAPYSSLEGTRFTFEPEDVTASPVSAASSARRDDSTTRFRFDSDSVSPRSMFEDDFTTISTPRGRTASIAEEDEGDIPPLRAKTQTNHRDIKKSESVNIFTRESDPFEGDAFFACTGSDKAARRENWPGDFQGFDNA